jgi:hypothetical protein
MDMGERRFIRDTTYASGRNPAEGLVAAYLTRYGTTATTGHLATPNLIKRAREIDAQTESEAKEKAADAGATALKGAEVQTSQTDS